MGARPGGTERTFGFLTFWKPHCTVDEMNMNQSNLTMNRNMFKSSTVLQLNYLHSLVTEGDGSKTQWYGENFLVSDLILNIFEKSGLNEHDLIQSHQEKIKKNAQIAYCASIKLLTQPCHWRRWEQDPVVRRELFGCQCRWRRCLRRPLEVARHTKRPRYPQQKGNSSWKIK